MLVMIESKGKMKMENSVNIHTHCKYEEVFLDRTHLGFVGLSVFRQLDELLGEHAAAVAQDVTLQLHVWTRTHELHHDGVAGGVDSNLHVLTTH